jgi:hypothetical protein
MATRKPDTGTKPAKRAAKPATMTPTPLPEAMNGKASPA